MLKFPIGIHHRVDCEKSLISAGDKRASEIDAQARDSNATQRQGSAEITLLFGASLTTRVLRVSRDRCISPPLLFPSEIRDYSQSNTKIRYETC